MIVTLLSHDDRKRRRAAQSRARRAGVEIAIFRVASGAVARHIAVLTEYLTDPSPQALRKLLAEENRHHVLEYLGKEKTSSRPSAADIDRAIEQARAERVRQVLTRNLLSDELEDIQLEMALVAGLSPAGEDPIEHMVLSWQAGEEPTPEQMEEALDVLLQVMGLSRHQAYAVVHGDTDNRHMHVAVNRVDPASGARVQIGLGVQRPLETLHQAVAIIEHRQGWRAQENGLYRADETGCYDRATGVMVRDAQSRPCSTKADQKRIREQRAREKEEKKISPAARDYERRTGFESLQRRVISTAAPPLRAAASWSDVHEGLATEGMRYRMLTSGAVIECGERTIAASTAWGGASADKMVDRLGRYEPHADDLQVASYYDRAIPAMQKVAEARRQALARRDNKRGLQRSVASANNAITRGYQDRVADAVEEVPEDLNAIRHGASSDLERLRAALLDLKAQAKRRAKQRSEDRFDGEAGETEPEHDDVQDGASAILLGARAQAAPLAVDPSILEAGYRVEARDDAISYYRQAQLQFVDYGEYIALHRTDDQVVRDALRLAGRKWGAVHACGDATFLARVVWLAVEEGIEIANPELQQSMELARREMASKQLAQPTTSASSPTMQAGAPSHLPTTQARAASHLPTPDVLRDYSPAFASWIDLANGSGNWSRSGARAAAIITDPELARQLQELESQQFLFARELRKAAVSWQRNQLAKLKHDTDDVEFRVALPLEPGARPSDDQLEVQGIVLVPQTDMGRPHARSPVGTTAPNDIVPAREIPAPSSKIAKAIEPYFPIAEARREKRTAALERELAEALRARVGSFEHPPRHIARLVLVDARQHASSAARRRAIVEDRDRQEIAALGQDPIFVRLLEGARLEAVMNLRRVRWPVSS